jgi:translation initiation factor IF-2
MSVRVHNLSKQLNMDNKELMAILKDEFRCDVKSPSSTVDNITAGAILEKFKDRLTPAAPPPPVPAPAVPAKAVVPPTGVVKTSDDIKRERSEREAAEAAAKAAAATTRTPVGIASPSTPLAAPKLPPLPPRPPTVAPAKPVSFAPTPNASGPSVRYPGMSAPRAAASNTSPSVKPASASTTQTRPPSLPPPSRAPAPLPPPPIAAKAPQLPTAPKVEEPEILPLAPGSKVVQIKPPIIVRDFALVIGLKPFRLISELMEMGIFASMNQAVDEEVAVRLARRHGYTIEIKHRGEQTTGSAPAPKKPEPPPVDESKFLVPRPPIVCVLGHVNHGKTSLLDAIRKTNVVAGEAGGITQHTGAYQIEHNGHKITFLDTPGHAAFSKMRERGANLTDIAVLVIAADDGFMPQTEEALAFAQKAGVPVVVAINKMDAKGANVERVKQAMQQHGIGSEDWGGETQCEPVSALKGLNIDKLLDAILLQAEVLELKANPQCPAEGVVVDSQVEIGRGATATIIVQKGTLKHGAAIVCGAHYCKVRAMVNDRDEPIKAAPPGTPVRLLGWSGAPDAGAKFHSVKHEREAKAEAEVVERELRHTAASSPIDRVSDLDTLLKAIHENKQKVFRCIIKGDVHGAVEALTACLLDIKSDKVNIEVVAAEVGPISQNDIIMASAAEAAVVGFNVRMENGVASQAKHKGVRIIQHDIIYELINQVRDAMAELLDPELRENKIGAAEVRQVFPLAKGFVAGCMVTEGRIARSAHARLLRKGEVIATGKIGTLKRFKDDASEVRAGFECGARIDGCDAYQPGDVIECFEILQIKPTL